MAIGKLSMKATDMIAISCASIVKCCNGFSKSKLPPYWTGLKPMTGLYWGAA